MTVQTRSQKLAQAAFPLIQDRKKREKGFDEYKSFAKKFPALIHTCGLAQAVAFALAKKETEYVENLVAVLKLIGHPEVSSAEALHKQSRDQPLSGYLRLSRDAINAASWLKRYVEAAGEGD
jgi:CRISPR-associated protein Cmr5